MGKQKKKRTKSYHGADAKNARPDIVRITAANRSGSQQWLFEHRKLLRPVLIAAGIVIVVIVLLIGSIGAFSA